MIADLLLLVTYTVVPCLYELSNLSASGYMHAYVSDESDTGMVLSITIF